MLAENYANSVLHQVTAGKFAEAIAFHERSLGISKKIDNQWGMVNSRLFVPLVYLSLGEIDRTLEAF